MSIPARNTGSTTTRRRAITRRRRSWRGSGRSTTSGRTWPEASRARFRRGAGVRAGREHAAAGTAAACRSRPGVGQGPWRQHSEDARGLHAAPCRGAEARRHGGTRHRADIFRADGLKNAPVVVFLHGGAYVRGDRDVNAEVYGNVPTYFARQGMLGVNATYRLPPPPQRPPPARATAAPSTAG